MMKRGVVKARKAPQPPPRALRAAAQHELSVVAAFDEFARNAAVLHDGDAEENFLKFVRKASLWAKRWRESESARREAAANAREKDRELLAKEYKIKQARKIVEDERKGRLQAEAERDAFAKQLEMLKNILLADDGHGRHAAIHGLDDATLERVRGIDTTTRPSRNSPLKSNVDLRLPALEESAESILDVSDMSFDETRDDLLGESRHKLAVPSDAANRSKRRSSGPTERAAKRRKSRSLGALVSAANDENKILSTTTKVTVDKEGNAHAESVIEAVPVSDLKRRARKSRESRGEAAAARRVTYNEQNLQQEFSPSAPPYVEDEEEHQQQHRHHHRRQQQQMSTPSPLSHSPMVKRNFSNASNIHHRPHNWQKLSVMRSDKCGPCGQRIGFKKSRYVCKECHAVCHLDCRENVPVPCVAATNRTPTNKSHGNLLADFTPAEPPMIPAILIHCFREVERRGLTEVGIYRIPGNEAESNEVQQRFHRGKGAPMLDKYEIHVLASAVKKFLRSLKEPVIPSSLWKTFVDAANSPDSTDAETLLYQAVSELPRPNRDTLAFMMLHLQKVAESPETKMNVDNLGRVWGPTIVGHSSHDPAAMISELPLQVAVVRSLLGISSDYWDNFLQSDGALLQSEQPSARRFPPIHTPENNPLPEPRPFQLPSALKSVGPVARRTRSKQIARQQYFESPMLF